MLDRILPLPIDNVYRGHRLGMVLFVAVLLVKSAIALGAIFNGRVAAQQADGIPLDSYGAGGAQAVLALFAIWGLAQLMFGALGFLALARYRSMIPLLLVLFLFEHAARRVIFLVKPIERTGSPPGLYMNLALLAAILAGLVLSLRGRRGAPLHP